VPCYHLSNKTHPEPGSLDQAILQTLKCHQADLIILAGYMRKLGARTLTHYRGRIINIHPSLLPRYGGEGMYGLNVHAAILAALEAETGVTIHLVDEEYDQGRIVAQCRMPVREQDTVETLAERVLVREHEFLVSTLIQIVSGEIALPV
jgi:phosphoribosylglycinamide formyltransferase-1